MYIAYNNNNNTLKHLMAWVFKNFNPSSFLGHKLFKGFFLRFVGLKYPNPI